MRYIFVILFLISITSCKSQYTGKLNSDQAVITADPKMEWVFGKNYKDYDPSESDIESAEKIMLQGFEDQKKGTVNRLSGKTPDEYFRQFVGAVDENGDKIVWVNCFCKRQEKYFKDWKTKLTYVMDGGNCFFNVEVNITKNTYSNFMVNGNA